MSPEEIVEYFCIEEPEEIDLEAICFHFNAEVRYENLNGCEGRLIGFRNRAIITANSSSSQNRKRFTIGHELGHWINDKGTSHHCTSEILERSWSGDTIETIANKFSARLLMPEAILRKKIPGIKFRIRDIQTLADQFRVSLTAMSLRLLKLDLIDGLLIASNGETRSWFCRNPSMPTQIFPIDVIDKESYAFNICKEELGHKRGCPMPGDMWINRADASKYELYEDSIVIAERKVLTLISFDDQEYLSKFI